jgi:hypothetical protein
MNTKTLGIYVVVAAMVASALTAVLPALVDDAFAGDRNQNRQVSRDNGRGGDSIANGNFNDQSRGDYSGGDNDEVDQSDSPVESDEGGDGNCINCGNDNDQET